MYLPFKSRRWVASKWASHNCSYEFLQQLVEAVIYWHWHWHAWAERDGDSLDFFKMETDNTHPRDESWAFSDGASKILESQVVDIFAYYFDS